jgi:exonuclease III
MSLIKILTWNLCWEAMKAEDSANINGTMCAPDICHNNVRNKIIEINTTKGLDFILLQEAQIDYNDLKTRLGANYEYIFYENGRAGNEEYSIIFYNKIKWQVLKEIKWGFHAGRPFIIALFQNRVTNQNILITNLHGPHGGLTDRTTRKKLLNYLDFLDYYRLGGPNEDYTGRDISKNPRVDLTDLPIIIGGDFNLEIPGPIQIFNQTFSNEGNKKTCCDTRTLKARGLWLSYDHILINDKLTYKTVEYPPVDDKMYSDHIPIYAEINIISYGFDFDGVIHKSVTIPDLDGQRHPKQSVADGNQIKNNIIINKIFEYLVTGHQIIIISSRWNQSIIKPFIIDKIKTMPGYRKEMDGKIVLNTEARGFKKQKTVVDSGVIEFYDDSVNVLKDIMERLRLTGKMMKLFLVRPELNDFIEINSEEQLDNELIKLNIRLLCNKSIKNEIDIDYIKLKEQINILMKTELKLMKTELKRVINIYGTVYARGTSDFAVLKDNRKENNLFIYNENRGQFIDKNSVSPGGGNGFLRVYRQDNSANLSKSEPKIKSLGIPTDVQGPTDVVINDSINKIFEEINKNPNIDSVYYSSDKTFDLGLGIFAGLPAAQANIKHISNELKAMFKKLRDEKNYEVHLFLLEGTTQTEYNLDTMKPI